MNSILTTNSEVSRAKQTNHNNDVETTGLSTVTDSIIELSGIKVIDSVIDESEKFVFSELVKPFKKKVSEEIECLTGISQNDVKDKREMWEVIADFMKFVGDSVLVGYNCINFDSKFLARAGRYGTQARRPAP